MKQGRAWKRSLAVLLSAAMVCGCAAAAMGCKKKKVDTTYTYNEYISMFPTSWNTHNAKSEADTYVQNYTEMGLYDLTFNDAKTSHAFIDEMAVGDPVDVTSSLVGKYGVQDKETGKAWKVKLNPDATWENGEAINAATYVDSMELLLSPEYKNNGATAYFTGNGAIYNAENYYRGANYIEFAPVPTDKTYTEAELDALIENGKLFFSFDMPIPAIGVSLKAFHDMFEKNPARYFIDENGKDWCNYLYDLYEGDANEYGYIQITRDNRKDFQDGWGFVSTKIAKFMPNWYNACATMKTTIKQQEPVPTDKTYTDAEIDALVRDGKLVFSFDMPIPAIGVSLKAFHDMFEKNPARYFIDENGKDWCDYLYDLYAGEADEYGYIKITAENLQDFKDGWGFVSTKIAKYMPNWYNACAIESEVEVEEVPFSEVGIFADKADPYALTIVFQNSLTMGEVKYVLTGNWIVYKPYYVEGTTQNGSLKTTNYGTMAGKYMGYGPYKLVTKQVDKEFIFERNEKWYGFIEGKKNYHGGGQYQTDRIVTHIVKDQSTALTMFLSGQLDQVKLTTNDLDTYRFSDYLLKRTASNTWQLSLNSDPVKLKAIEDEENDGNRRILAVADFRRGLSLMLDRGYIGANIAGGSSAAFSVVNDNYYYDKANNPDSIYRATPEAKQAILDLYGIEYGADKTYKTIDDAYKAVTGYDMTAATEAFKRAAAEAVEKEYYAKGDKIKINIYVSALNAQMNALGSYMQQQVTAATKGTDLEGKVTIAFKEKSTNRYDDMRAGKLEGVYQSMMNADYDPIALVEGMTNPDKKPLEYGFKPAEEKFSITYAFNGTEETTVEKTFDDWQKSIAAGGEYAKHNPTKLAILSKLEYELLSRFQAIPLYVGTDSLLYSKKVKYASEKSNIYVAYGGLRLMTYTMNDGEWADYCKKNDLKYV